MTHRSLAKSAALCLTWMTVGLAPPALAEDSSPARGFITAQSPGQWLTSRMVGTTVVTAHNETIGDVSDVIIGRDGQAVGLVIGVGGFLGLGEKTVAVALDRVEMDALRANGAELHEARPPDRVVLHVTREELREAPEFKPAGRPLPKLPGLSDRR